MYSWRFWLSISCLLMILLPVACAGAPGEGRSDAPPPLRPATPLQPAGVAPALRYATSTPVRFEHLSLEAGLSQSVALDILQDSQGFLWIATQDGLNRYDGYTFVVHKHDADVPHSLSSDFILTLAEDPAGVLWFGTFGGGLNKFDPARQKFTLIRHDPEAGQGLSGDQIWAFHEDRAGALWIGANGAGLDRYDPATGRWQNYRADPADPDSLSGDWVLAIHEDQSGAVWVGNFGDSLNRLDGENGRFTHYDDAPSVAAFYEDKTGQPQRR